MWLWVQAQSALHWPDFRLELLHLFLQQNCTEIYAERRHRLEIWQRFGQLFARVGAIASTVYHWIVSCFSTAFDNCDRSNEEFLSVVHGGEYVVSEQKPCDAECIKNYASIQNDDKQGERHYKPCCNLHTRYFLLEDNCFPHTHYIGFAVLAVDRVWFLIL